MCLQIVDLPQLLHVCVNDDQGEGDEEVEEKPKINHLQIGSLWKAIVHLNFKAIPSPHQMTVMNDGCQI